MNSTLQNTPKKSKLPRSSVVMYLAGIIFFLIAVGSLVLNIMLYSKTVSQYLSQGYPASISKDILIAQLLPALFQTISCYMGIAFILLAAGLINHKISQLLRKDDGTASEIKQNTETPVPAVETEPLEHDSEDQK